MAHLREGLVVAGSALAFFVIACDGKSKTNIHDGDGNGGASGDMSGGSSGKGGTGAQGGSSGAASGGTSGKGGSAGSSAGTSGSAGASTGGASGSAGAGGTAGRGYRPPDRQLAGCTRNCELEQAAMCPAEETFEKCVEGCHVGILFEVCSEAWDAWFACLGTAEAAECGTDGTASIPECNDEAGVALDCVTMVGVTDALAVPCAANCAAAAAAMCPNGGDPTGCSFECRAIASAFPVCADSYRAALECSAEAEQTCDAEGEPQASGCATEFGAFLDCLDADYAWQPGRGIVR